MVGFERTLAEKFQEGIEWACRGQFERADALLRQCVTADPANSRYVAVFLENLALKAPSPSAASKPRDALPADGDALPVELAQAEAAEQWSEVLRRGPQYLSAHPWHLRTLLLMAEACAAEELAEEEFLYLNRALQAAPDDAAANRRAARAYAKLQQFEAALAHWHRVEQNDPDDAEPARQIAQLSILLSRQQAGLDPVPVLPFPLVPEKLLCVDKSAQASSQGVLATGAGAELHLTPIQRLEAAVRDRPLDIALYSQLTALYLEKDRDYDAERMLAKAKGITDGDPQVTQLWEDVTLLRLEKKIAQARRRAEVEGTEEARRAAADLARERDDFEVQLYTQRCQRDPHNAHVRFQLGLRLKGAGRDKEATQQFEAALAQEGTLRGDSAYELAQCCEGCGEWDQAMRYYRLAAGSSCAAMKQGRRAEALCRASRIALRLQLFQLAQRYLAELRQCEPKHAEAKAIELEIERHSRQYASSAAAASL
jgi:tetratricopeptide (TPR) repeat protein